VTLPRYILIADDDELVRGFIVRVVRSVLPTAVVLEATTGPEVLAAIQQYAPVALITDYHMPGVSNVDLIAQARAQHPAMPIIVVSAHEEIEQAVLGAGANVFLAKPVSLVQLTHTVQSIVQLP